MKNSEDLACVRVFSRLIPDRKSKYGDPIVLYVPRGAGYGMGRIWHVLHEDTRARKRATHDEGSQWPKASSHGVSKRVPRQKKAIIGV